ncbi:MULTISPECIES: phytanoyl-CoA dioxygenase family protein [unclassified Bordetella]|uniref:phytanoyl-CoA dioxygenase family protein n=1 Tax=unclassified Bordetella TaxID=2630031 RepID=UPI0013272249|nr:MULTISPECIES: phytanoyl-CoA dioxygenase family protein [unclassified Bordetella]MVW71989.1 phytanoyl-CoA dioxygenase family protein [Bordetella sp. 15P40C-2]MVW79246.1 phytanoyl-CoA dioxygenase family protein [Bordetella sp. 02P26C-1]
MSASSVAEQVQTLREQGFVVARQFASPEIVQALRAEAQRQLDAVIEPIEYEADLQYPGAPPSRDAQGGATVRRLLDAYRRGPLFQQWATRQDIGAWLRAYFGETPVLSRAHHNCVMTKHPAYGSLTGWHQDIRYWSFSEDDLVSTWLALGHETADNGGLFFLPGSHTAAFDASQFDEQKFFRADLPQNQAWIERAVCPTLEPGDVVFFHCRTLHAARQNSSDQVKLSLVHTYHPESCSPLPGTRSASLPGVPLAG